MKNFLKPIPNKLKAVYILWVFIHSLFWLFGGFHFLTSEEKVYRGFQFFRTYTNRLYKYFFPFQTIDTEYYDVTELLVYCISPVILYLFFWLWKKKEN